MGVDRVRNATSGDAGPPAASELETVFAANLTTRRSLFTCITVGVTAVVLVAAGLLGPPVAHAPGDVAGPRGGPQLTESAELEIRAVAEARALAAMRPVRRLTESAELELRAVAEARALAAIPRQRG